MQAETPIAEGRSFASRLRHFGGQPAIVADGGERLSYEELADRVDAFAARLGTSRRLLLIEATGHRHRRQTRKRRRDSEDIVQIHGQWIGLRLAQRESGGRCGRSQ